MAESDTPLDAAATAIFHAGYDLGPHGKLVARRLAEAALTAAESGELLPLRTHVSELAWRVRDPRTASSERTEWDVWPCPRCGEIIGSEPDDSGCDHIAVDGDDRMAEPVHVVAVDTGSPLRALVTAYLRATGFHRARNGLWGHVELGEGRTFEQVVDWQMGRELACNE